METNYPYIPHRAYFEEEALKYPLGQKIYHTLEKLGVEIKKTPSHNRVTGIPGKTPQEQYLEGKNTMVIGVRRTLNFQSCKPSAHYQLPLNTSCPSTPVVPGNVSTVILIQPSGKNPICGFM